MTAASLIEQQHSWYFADPTFFWHTRASGATYAAVPHELKGKVALFSSSSSTRLRPKSESCNNRHRMGISRQVLTGRHLVALAMMLPARTYCDDEQWMDFSADIRMSLLQHMQQTADVTPGSMWLPYILYAACSRLTGPHCIRSQAVVLNSTCCIA